MTIGRTLQLAVLIAVLGSSAVSARADTLATIRQRGVLVWGAAILGLAANCAAYETEIYRAGLPAIPHGQMEAALSLGMSRSLAVRRIIVPQAVRPVIPPVMNDFIALAMKPQVILFDEPTSSLDPRMTAEVIRVMTDLAQSGQTMIVVTHALGFARRVAHTVHVMREGRLAESGPPAQIFERPEQEVTRVCLAQERDETGADTTAPEPKRGL